MAIFAGLDIGSTTGKAVLLDDRDRILASTVVAVTTRPEETARICMEGVLRQADLKEEDITYVVGTGYGRARVPYESENISEITCHAMGAHWLHPGVRTVLDIGGQDCKAIGVLEDGRVREFVMNDKCAAGTGRFLEVQARALGVDVRDFSELAKKADSPALISAQCSVFAETEVITLLNAGSSVENIVAGLHLSIVGRLISLLRRVGIEEDLTVTGGCAKNEELIRILQEKVGVKVVPLKGDPQIIGALGAAILAHRKWTKRGAV